MTDKKPLIAVGDRDTFGGLRDSAQFHDPETQAADPTYVPGYSDLRRHNSLAATDFGRQHGMKKVRVENRLHWVRTQKPASGAPDARDVTSHLARGYQFVTTENIASLGIEAPPAAQVDLATKRYVVGDTTLMYCTREVAQRNENVLRRATEERSSVEATSSALHQEGQRQARQAGQDNLTEATVSHETEVRRG